MSVLQALLTMTEANVFSVQLELSGMPPAELATHALKPSSTMSLPKDVFAHHLLQISLVADVEFVDLIKFITPTLNNARAAQHLLHSSQMVNVWLAQLELTTMPFKSNV